MADPFKDTRDPLVRTLLRNSQERAADQLRRAVELLARYYWVQSKRQGQRVDNDAALFFEEIGEGWRKTSLHPIPPQSDGSGDANG